MRTTPCLTLLLPALLLAGCGSGAPVYDPRGVDREETLLSVSATGEAEARPDEARFQAGVESFAANARDANAANERAIAEVVGALREAGVAEEDLQTRSAGVQRIDWGDRKGQYQASTIIAVTVRDIERTSPVLSAVTEAGANIVSGPDLRIANSEAATNSAYAAAFRNARARAEAYAEAGDMTIARVLSIRDAGGAQGNRYVPGAVPPPVAAPVVAQAVMPEEGAGRVLAGQTMSSVAVQVDFALVPK
jgi:uncharacterized protein YggE